MRVEFSLNIGWNNKQTEVVEYDGDMTDEELDVEWSIWSSDYIDGYWKRIDEESKWVGTLYQINGNNTL